jgi:hypothetical protein
LSVVYVHSCASDMIIEVEDWHSHGLKTVVVVSILIGFGFREWAWIDGGDDIEVVMRSNR